MESSSILTEPLGPQGREAISIDALEGDAYADANRLWRIDRRGQRSLVLAARNVRMMHLLERIAKVFDDAGVPLMVLKGGALNLTIVRRPHQRPMADLDLMVKVEHLEQAFALLEQVRCLRRQVLVREDFFPRYYYEVEFEAGDVDPVTVDLHVRPLRPLRYARLVPPDAFWARAQQVAFGEARLLIPGVEDMLIHLAAHSAVHGNRRSDWLIDVRRWSHVHRDEIDWDQLVDTAKSWGLALPVLGCLRVVQSSGGRVCPPNVPERLKAAPANWRDRLALWHAPRDDNHPVMHVLVNALTTPGWRFTFGYLLAVVVPDRGHMGEWYVRRHVGWLPCAHVLRVLNPLVSRLPRVWNWFRKTQVKRSGIHGVGVFATRHIKAGELIGRFRGRPVERDGIYVSYVNNASGVQQRYEITGDLKFLNHHCRPNAVLNNFQTVALRPVNKGQEITINYGDGTCECSKHHTLCGQAESKQRQ